MPGRLRSNFRSGNLAENLGILLLKGIAAVAEVPRTEDVGLDAVATLLRRDRDGNHYAEDSFVLQLKAEGELKGRKRGGKEKKWPSLMIRYSDHELDWFLQQRQPMFIGLVSTKEGRISIYPTLNVNAAVLALDSRKVEIRFGPSGFPPAFKGTPNLNWTAGPDDSAIIWLGEPLLTWSLTDLVSSKWSADAYKTLKSFLALARLESENISLGQSSNVIWRENDPDSIKAASLFMKGGPDQFDQLAKQSLPILRAIAMQLVVMPREKANILRGPLRELTEGFTKLGINMEPSGIFRTLKQIQ